MDGTGFAVCNFIVVEDKNKSGKNYSSSVWLIL